MPVIFLLNAYQAEPPTTPDYLGDRPVVVEDIEDIITFELERTTGIPEERPFRFDSPRVYTLPPHVAINYRRHSWQEVDLLLNATERLVEAYRHDLRHSHQADPPRVIVAGDAPPVVFMAIGRLLKDRHASWTTVVTRHTAYEIPGSKVLGDLGAICDSADFPRSDRMMHRVHRPILPHMQIFTMSPFKCAKVYAMDNSPISVFVDVTGIREPTRLSGTQLLHLRGSTAPQFLFATDTMPLIGAALSVHVRLVEGRWDCPVLFETTGDIAMAFLIGRTFQNRPHVEAVVSSDTSVFTIRLPTTESSSPSRGGGGVCKTQGQAQAFATRKNSTIPSEEPLQKQSSPVIHRTPSPTFSPIWEEEDIELAYGD